MHILFAGGGTAGHINPALAIAGYIKEMEPNTKISYIGTADKLEAIVGGKYRIIYGADELEKCILGTCHDVIVHSIAGLEGTRAALAAAKTGALSSNPGQGRTVIPR